MLHRFRRRDSEQAKAVGEHDFCGQDQVQAHVADVFVLDQELLGIVVGVKLGRQ